MDKNYLNEIHVTSNYKKASVSYGLFVGLIGIVLNTIEPFKICSICGNPLKLVVEGFYIYMYTMSIIWIIVMFVLLILAKRLEQVSIKHYHGMRRLSTVKNFKNSLSPQKKPLRQISNNTDKQSNKENIEENFEIEEFIDYQDNFKVKFGLDDSFDTKMAEDQIKRNLIKQSVKDNSNFRFAYDYENGTGELYMRCGVGIFSICTMIDRCLGLVQLLEVYTNSPKSINKCPAAIVFTLLAQILSLLFIFLQSFLIFKYANIIINYCKNLAIVGLMHLVCTNFCVSFRTVVLETIAEIRHHNHDKHLFASTTTKALSTIFNSSLNDISHHHVEKRLAKNMTDIISDPLKCVEENEFNSNIILFVKDAREKLDSYLYPSIIEYSLLSMTVFYILWKSIDNGLIKKSNKSSTKEIENNECEESVPRINDEEFSKIHCSKRNNSISFFSGQKRDANQFTVDCSKSTTGLFLGILVLLLTLMSLITYFIYYSHNHISAVILSEITELCLISCSLFVVIFCFFQLKYYKFKYLVEFNMSTDSILVIFGLAGIYLYSVYSIIAILDSSEKSKLKETSTKIFLIVHFLTIIESTLQSMLIIQALKMYTVDKQVMKKKPGRSLITLLILVNISIWLLENLSVKKYGMSTIQLDYYGIVFWSIASSISTPLAIFYRFHASVCLSDIWKTLYEHSEHKEILNNNNSNSEMTFEAKL